MSEPSGLRTVLSFPLESKAHAAYLASFRNALHALPTRGGAGIALGHATSPLRGRLTPRFASFPIPAFPVAMARDTLLRHNL